jgi:hypothetical protein
MYDGADLQLNKRRKTGSECAESILYEAHNIVHFLTKFPPMTNHAWPQQS